MNIRPETVQDYPVITDINIRAFGERYAEALVVTLLRHRARFDPELSLVAEVDGKVVGHVLFSPHRIRLLGQDVQAVNLAPLAVDVPYQKTGIGKALIAEGHRVALSKDYPLSFLLGHPPYYPRFGYRTGVYGASLVNVPTDDLPRKDDLSTHLETRAPLEKDIPVLRDLWLREEGNIDFVVFPGDSLGDWLSPNPMIECRVYLQDEKVVGYTSIKTTEPSSPRLFLAQDDEIARLMAADIGFAVTSITLPLHPYSASATVFKGAEVQAWDAAMACPLAPSLFDEFYAKLQAGERLPGRAVWPTAFDVA